MLRIIVALLVLIAGAAALLTLPEPSAVQERTRKAADDALGAGPGEPTIEASAGPSSRKPADEAKTETSAAAASRCSGRAWPYFDRRCLNQGKSQTKVAGTGHIRLIQTDPLALTDPPPAATPPAEPQPTPAAAPPPPEPTVAAEPPPPNPAGAAPPQEEAQTVVVERVFVADGPGGQGHWEQRMVRVGPPVASASEGSRRGAPGNRRLAMQRDGFPAAPGTNFETPPDYAAPGRNVQAPPAYTVPGARAIETPPAGWRTAPNADRRDGVITERRFVRDGRGGGRWEQHDIRIEGDARGGARFRDPRPYPRSPSSFPPSYDYR